VTGGVSVVYKIDSTAEKSATLWLKDGDQDEWRFVGCRGTVTFEMESGKFGVAKFALRGHLGQAPTNTSAWTNTYDTTTPTPLLNVPVVIGGTTFDQSKVTIDTGNSISVQPLLNATDGFSEIRISKRAAKASVTILPPAASVGSPVADLIANTTRTLTQVAVGGTAGNKYQFTFGGGGRYSSVDDGDTDGIVSYDMQINLAESALGADDELSLTFT